MLFSEPFFLFFFLPILVIVYYIVPKPVRNTILLFASLFFYASGEKIFVLLMITSILINYLIGIGINKAEGQKKRKFILSSGIFINLLLLVIFKYINFIIANINYIFIHLDLQEIPHTPIHLPIGISFFTFQAMSYIIDLYRNKTGCQRNPAKLALYITFFPQLIAGPIVRYTDISYQLDKRTETINKFSYGVKRFIIGLAKKMIIANTVALQVDRIFDLPASELTFGIAWLAIICYALQIYFDFSGYSDMAIGLGRIFGFKFPENFNYPYISRSITEFWRRWHISLSSWFRDYLYIPLGGNKISQPRTYFNLLIVFLLCGLWHGASWNFIAWGCFHGFLLIIERIGLNKMLNRCSRIIQHLYVLFSVLISWVLFRAETIPQTLDIFSVMLISPLHNPEIRHISHYFNIEIFITIIVGILASTPLLKIVYSKVNNKTAELNIWLFKIINLMKLSGLVFIFVYSVMLLASGAYNPFIYFRF